MAKKRENGTEAINFFDMFDNFSFEVSNVVTPKKTTIKENVIPIKKKVSNKNSVDVSVKTKTKKETKVINITKDNDKLFEEKDLLLGKENIPGTISQRYSENLNVLNLLTKYNKNKDALNSIDNKKILGKFSGWGGHSKKFEEGSESNEQIKALMSKEQYKSAQESILTAYYTPLYMIKFMYKVIQQFGFENGKILDPSTGTGRFLSGMSEEMYYTSKITAIEADDITSQISSVLFSESEVIHGNYQDIILRDNSFDLCISNIPFGSYSIFDNNDKALNECKYNLHDYFFAKSIMKTREGGLIAFITSTSTLDSSKSKNIREYINNTCNFLGAVRFPIGTFVDTSVCCDMIFLQKTNTVNIKHKFLEVIEQDEITMNEYFHNNKDMIVHDEIIMEPFAGKGNPIMKCKVNNKMDNKLLEKFIKLNKFDKNVYKGSIDDSYMFEKDELTICRDTSIRNDEVILIDNKLYQKQNNYLIPLNYKGETKHIFNSYIKIKNALKNTLNIQQFNYSDEKFKEALKELNIHYDYFNKKYGFVNKPKNKSILKKDISYYNIASLENYDYVNKSYTKSDIFFRRSLIMHEKKEITNPIDAFKQCLSTYGFLKIDYIVDILKDTDYAEDIILSELCEKKLIAYIPYENKYIEYRHLVSGFTKPRLERHIEEYKKLSELIPNSDKEKEIKDFNSFHYDKNIEILKENQPEYITDTKFNLSSSWIPIKYKIDFFAQILKISESSINLTYTNHYGYMFECRSGIDYLVERDYGTKRRKSIKIVNDTLNMKDIIIYDHFEDENGNKVSKRNLKETQAARNVQERLRLEFISFINSNIRYKDELTQFYNDTFNNFIDPIYENILFDLNINPEINLREHQLRGASRIITSPYSTLLSHSVGSGKTYTMIAASQEIININTVNNLPTKNLIVVPKSLCESGQFAKDYLTLYPQANILATTSKDFTVQNRRRLLSKIVTNSYDAIIISHSSLSQIPLTPQTEKEFIDEDINELLNMLDYYKRHRASKGIKDTQRAIKKMKEKLQELNDIKRDNGLFYWEQLGITNIFIDEAHNFKNLSFTTGLQVAGLSNTEAQKSRDLYNKVRYTKNNYKHSKITFASATPVSNSLGEIYTLKRYLMPELLKKFNVDCFDSWASSFSTVEATMEIDSTGTAYKAKSRMKLVNIPELMNIFKLSTDIVDIKNIDEIVLPKNNIINIELEPTMEMTLKIEELVERSKIIQGGNVDPEVDNMLKIVHEGKLLCVAPKLLGIDEESIKVDALINNLTELLNKHKKASHLVFCDVGTPDNEVHNVYKDIKDKLIKNGFKNEEIAYVSSKDTSVQRKFLIAQFRDAKIRVLIGSTSILGEGLNAQDHLLTLHHLSVPWRPSDIEQRVGRMVRQFNKNKEVYEYRYVVKRSFDAFAWQIVEKKEAEIKKIFASDKTLREMDDIVDSEFSYAQTKACACGDTRILDLHNIEQDLRKYIYLEKAYADKKLATYSRIKSNIKRLTELKENIPLLQQDINILKEACKNKDFLRLNGYEPTNVIEDIKNNLKEIVYNDIPGDLGYIYGLNIFYEKCDKKLYIGSSTLLAIAYYKIPGRLLDNLLNIRNTIIGIYKHCIDEYNKLSEETKALKNLINLPFEYQEKLNELTIKKKNLETELLLEANEDLKGNEEEEELEFAN